MSRERGGAVFSRATVAWLVLVGGGAFCAMLAATALHDPAEGDITAASTYSRSAVGHSAFAALLQAEGYRTRMNRDVALAGLDSDDLLVILAPNSGEHDLQRLRLFIQQAVTASRPVLLGLPKWETRPSQAKRGWIDRARRMPDERLAEVLGALPEFDEDALVQGGNESAWQSRSGVAPSLDEPFLIAPTMDWERFVWNAEGTLLGRVRDTPIAVLSDVDLLANHGLHRGENANLALAMIDRLLPAGGSVVFDESLHGFATVHNVWRLLFQPPYVAATALALAAAAMTIWLAAVRFGAPLPAASGPAFQRGHATLIDNAGRLLAAGGHADVVARRYRDAAQAEAQRRLHLPPANAAVAVAALNAVAERRGIQARLPAPDEQLRPLALARRWRHWMQEMFGDG